MPNSKRQTPTEFLFESLAPYRTWKKLLLAGMALLSLLFTHYVGFLLALPETIRDLAAERFATSYSSTFALAAGISYAIGRVTTIVLVPMLVLLAAIALRLVVWRGRSFARRFIRIRRFGDASAPFLALILAILVFLELYTPSASLLQFTNAFVLVVIAGFLTSPALPSLIKAKTTQLQPGTPKERARRPFVVAAMLGWLVAALLVCALLLGVERFRHLSSRTVHALATPCLKRPVVVLLASNDQFLAVTSAEAALREYILAGPTFAVSSSASSPSAACPH